MHTIVTSISFVIRVLLSLAPRFDEIQIFLQECVEDLADPVSVRHSSTMQLLVGFTPFLVYAVPGLVVDAAHLALPGIGATDTLKTLVTAAFLVNLFMQVPALDLSTRELPAELASVIREASPMLSEANGATTPVAPATRRELRMCTFMLPDLRLDLLERFLEYVQAVPEPSRRDGVAAREGRGAAGIAVASPRRPRVGREREDSALRRPSSRLRPVPRPRQGRGRRPASTPRRPAGRS